MKFAATARNPSTPACHNGIQVAQWVLWRILHRIAGVSYLIAWTFLWSGIASRSSGSLLWTSCFCSSISQSGFHRGRHLSKPAVSKALSSLIRSAWVLKLSSEGVAALLSSASFPFGHSLEKEDPMCQGKPAEGSHGRLLWSCIFCSLWSLAGPCPNLSFPFEWPRAITACWAWPLRPCSSMKAR